MTFAVEETITPMINSKHPKRAAYRRPIRSSIEPTKGQTAARARRLARIDQTQLEGLAKVEYFDERHVPIVPADISIDVR